MSPVAGCSFLVRRTVRSDKRRATSNTQPRRVALDGGVGLAYAAVASSMRTISSPIASEAVAPGLGALSTCRAFGREMK